MIKTDEQFIQTDTNLQIEDIKETTQPTNRQVDRLTDGWIDRHTDRQAG